MSNRLHTFIINKFKKFKRENRYVNKMHDITLTIDKKTIYANTFDELQDLRNI